MKVPFDKIGIGEFFVFKLGEDTHIYQKIKPYKDYNSLHLNSGNLSNIYSKNTDVEKVSLEFTIKYDE